MSGTFCKNGNRSPWDDHKCSAGSSVQGTDQDRDESEESDFPLQAVSDSDSSSTAVVEPDS